MSYFHPSTLSLYFALRPPHGALYIGVTGVPSTTTTTTRRRRRRRSSFPLRPFRKRWPDGRSDVVRRAAFDLALVSAGEDDVHYLLRRPIHRSAGNIAEWTTFHVDTRSDFSHGKSEFGVAKRPKIVAGWFAFPVAVVDGKFKCNDGLRKGHTRHRRCDPVDASVRGSSDFMEPTIHVEIRAILIEADRLFLSAAPPAKVSPGFFWFVNGRATGLRRVELDLIGCYWISLGTRSNNKTHTKRRARPLLTLFRIFGVDHSLSPALAATPETPLSAREGRDLVVLAGVVSRSAARHVESRLCARRAAETKAGRVFCFVFKPVPIFCLVSFVSGRLCRTERRLNGGGGGGWNGFSSGTLLQFLESPNVHRP